MSEPTLKATAGLPYLTAQANRRGLAKRKSSDGLGRIDLISHHASKASEPIVEAPSWGTHTVEPVPPCRGLTDQFRSGFRCWRSPSFTCSIAASVEGTWRSAFSSTKSWIVPL